MPGIPLKALNGTKLGTFCIIDQKPREFSKEDTEALSDLALMAERELNMSEMVLYDDLTGLLNRRGIIDRTNETLKLCMRFDVPACIVYLDLDKFKLINDTLGHKEGDQALRIFSNSIKSSFRASDVCARVGGDEFVLLLHKANKLDCEKAIEHFKLRLNQACNEENTCYELEFSYGIISVDMTQHNTVEDLMHHSDTIMYKHKEAKKKMEAMS